MYSSTFPSNSAIDGVLWSMLCPVRFTTEKDQVPIIKEAGLALWLVWRYADISPPSGFDFRAVQPVVSCYSHSAIPGAQVQVIQNYKFLQFVQQYNPEPAIITTCDFLLRTLSDLAALRIKDLYQTKTYQFVITNKSVQCIETLDMNNVL